MAEFTMLRQMTALDLPVPTAIAARMVKHSFGYSADIMIARIDGSRDLFAHLQQQPLRAEQWQALGKLIARFHRAGVYHSDLNCHNILLDDKQFWLIDFDKCGWSVAPKLQQEMLDRLLRSFHKEQQKATLQGQSFYFSPTDFDILLAAYAARE
jgi:tRNA A-37 threonylcarbamoyl transferase component Bud32